MLPNMGWWVLTHWKAVGTGLIVLVVLSGGLYIKSLRADVATEKATNATLTATLKTAQEQIDAYSQQAANTINVVAAEREEAVARVTAARDREKEILNAPKDQDGPVAPVLRASLQRLRQ